MKTDVFIAGGGVGGLALAVKLASRGVHVTVVEQLAKKSSAYKGELLQPKTLAILDTLNVLAETEANGHVIDQLRFLEVERQAHDHPNEIQLTELNYSRVASKYDHSLMVPHETTKDILREKGAAYAEHFNYLAGTRFLGFENGMAKVRQKKSIQYIEADVYVGAEGRSSPTREAMNVRVKRRDYNHHFLTVTIPRPSDFTKGKMVTTADQFLGLFPLPDQQVRTVYLIKAGTFKQIKERGLPYLYQAYSELEPELSEGVRAIQDWKAVQLMIPFTYHVDSYYRGNLALIGDAAHTVHPMAGEGMNLAIQDADVLGELLAWCREQGEPFHKHLHYYEDVRKPRVEFLLNISHLSALVYSLPYQWWRNIRRRAMQRMYDDDELHVKQMLNISGLGKWNFTLVDRAIQGSILPARSKKVSDRKQQQFLFSEAEDYPWRTLQKGKV
ncbi:FAD-dependent oxidoreductase [Halobacillus naozhouensis]|uniref:FAD-dependent monooxygenase n=1 Tax=Halobacillus naozhouensis TaxID=554880 RepID=A0ABY8IWF3_9BACI|nr:FAD-dependent monooxygenase [Halobacillus naozhouensis]WFT74350.1 FAD-dependent monooxygenase [Halobacillus naozhouensis]